ncbi:MAG: hypothetical protein JWM11_1459, partial [Planctomycetaceae bacterium]|nr:hypothetical protein [Planctomycetaceae bacterium]
FALCPDELTAEALRKDLRSTNWGDCEISCVAPKNSGAKVEFSP